MAIRQDFYSPNFEDMGDYSGRSLFGNRFDNFQDFETFTAPPPSLMPTLAPASAPASAPAMDTAVQTQVRGEELRAQNAARLAAEQEAAAMQAMAQIQPAPVQQPEATAVAAPAPAAPVQDKTSIINNLISQIKARSNTSQWSGGYGADEATKDMARILADTGITDISQFGPITQQVERVVGYEDWGAPIYQTVTEQTFGNKLTGQAVPNTYSERQKGDFFGGTFEGKGNTGYGVQFDAQGNPVFYTQGASSKDPIVKAAIPIGLMALGAYGAESLFGAGATGAGSAGAAAAGELGTLAGTAGGTGITAGASGLGLNAAGAGLGAAGTGAGITAGAGLTGTGVLTGSSLGTGLLGTGATVAGLTGTGILSGSELGSALLGTTPTTPLVGTGVLSGSSLGTELLGTGVGSPVITPPPAPPPVIEPVASIQPSPVSSGTGITANNSGFGINAGSTGLNTIAVDGGLTGTGILTGSSLGTELLGTGLGAAGLTGTGILAGSELGTGLLGTTSTTPLVGTGVLSGSTLGTELLGTGANTAATVGGVTGLTNAANVGYGALNTGVSTGLTGLGSGAVDTGVNPSGATTGVVDPTAAAATSTAPPVESTNPLSSLTPSQLANILNGVVSLFGIAGATQLGRGGGGGSSMGVGALPTQGIPLNSEDYFNAIQQNYNTLMPAMPKDVATPLANWYNSQYGA